MHPLLYIPLATALVQSLTTSCLGFCIAAKLSLLPITFLTPNSFSSYHQNEPLNYKYQSVTILLKPI